MDTKLKPEMMKPLLEKNVDIRPDGVELAGIIHVVSDTISMG